MQKILLSCQSFKSCIFLPESPRGTKRLFTYNKGGKIAKSPHGMFCMGFTTFSSDSMLSKILIEHERRMSTVEAGRRPQAPGGRRGQMFVRSESLSFQGFPLTQTTRVAEGAFYFFTIRVARGALHLLKVHAPSARP